MKSHKILAAVAATAVLTLTLDACSTNDRRPTPSATPIDADAHNAADVDFATQMIPHHEQALEMVDVARDHDLSPAIRKLTEDIRAAQGPEIKLMRSWLKAWKEPMTRPSGHHGMEGEHHGGLEMPGMMADAEMSDLKRAQGKAFEVMWLQMMIKHHEGAISMAKEEQTSGSFGPALRLAKSIAAAQQAEIDHMQNLLKS